MRRVKHTIAIASIDKPNETRPDTLPISLKTSQEETAFQKPIIWSLKPFTKYIVPSPNNSNK